MLNIPTLNEGALAFLALLVLLCGIYVLHFGGGLPLIRSDKRGGAHG